MFGFCWLVDFFLFLLEECGFFVCGGVVLGGVCVFLGVLFVFICLLFCFCGGGNGSKGKVRGQKTQGPEESLLALLQIIPLCIYHTTCVLILA